jgi:iron complex outermembrane recepter protein
MKGGREGARSYRCVRPARWFAALAVSALALCAGRARAADIITFVIAAGPARQTLWQFQDQANVWVLFGYDEAAPVTTHPVSGPLEPAAALAQMLQGTGLTFTFGDRVKGRQIVTVGRSAVKQPSPPAPGLDTAQPTRSPGASAASHRGDVLEEVTVTGTHIHDMDPVGAPPRVYTPGDIEEFGATTLAEFLQSTPETFGGGATEDTHIGTEALSNTGFGVGLNLRGLGSEATLILVNGRRPAPSGSNGAFTDISVIPLIAVQRVEVLTDGASAVYGSDAVGGVVNIITQDSDLTSNRQKYLGAETRLQMGSVTDGVMREQRFGQLFGWSWGTVDGALAVEYYHRDALDARDRELARSDLTPWGGNNFDTDFSNPGNIVAGTQTWAIPHGQNGQSLKPSDLTAGTINLQNQYQDAQILPSQRRFSLYGAERASLGDTVTAFADVLVSERRANEQNGGAGYGMMVPSTNPFYVNPTGETDPITVYYNFLDDLGTATTSAAVQTVNVGAGLNVYVGRGWQVGATLSDATEKQNVSTTGVPDITALEVALSDPNPATAFNPFGDGSHTNPATLAAIRGETQFHMTSTLQGASVSADGPIVELPAGALKGALGVEFRQQSFESSQTQNLLYAASHSVLGRHLWAAFGEVVVPIVAPGHSFEGLRKLELSVAARHEGYGNSDSTIPKYALTWSPIQRVEFGGTWAKSSRPPNLGDLDESRNVSGPIVLPDPKSPSGTTTALVWSGNNAQLKAERATNWTLSARVNREDAQGLSAGLTYFNIAFTNRIQGFTLSADALQNQNYASIVTRNPTPALIDQICSTTINIAGSADNCRSIAYGAVVDLRIRNVQTLQTQGVDFYESYKLPSRFGDFSVGLNGTYMFEYALTSPPGGRFSLLNTLSNPIELHMHSSIAWNYHRIGVIVSGNYTNSYWNPQTVPTSKIDSWTTADVQLKWVLGAPGSWLEDTEFRLTMRNVFDQNPPFVSNASAGIGYDQENGDLTNRFVILGIAKRW